ncbi:MAG: asparagine synthase (glutamine-hydrolyzing) [Desulforhabdus sp.]|jgi:asparagine synthase (glutamine-hydrolysing)|nr:asparagine synthase (glutamine-hydrolyzing) [Desulforhabdus sp.]
MCGIAGYFQLKDQIGKDLQLLQRMIYPLAHRGPDGFGFFQDEIAGLAHARLSIIDLEGGWQPIGNEDRTLWIIFNGEIFNYPELRAELVQRGHVFSSQSDTEVILHLFEDQGARCLEALNGQFALAIYDSRQRSLFLARDRMGIRPLFYTVHDGIFYFGSEIKSIFNASAQLPRQFDARALGEIFTFWSVAGEQTVFAGIRQLLPGHYLEVDLGGVQGPQSFWSLPFCPDEPGRKDEREYAEQLRELLVDAVRLRLRADVPVGAYLSGGLDSSCITSLIRNYTVNPLKTFSVTFADRVYDEQAEQDEMAGYLGTDHRRISCSYADIAAAFPQVIWHTETPVLRTAPTPLYLLSGLVRRTGYKVVLTGEGADEILGGYDLFKEAKIRAFIRAVPGSRLRPQLLKRLYPYLALSPTRSSEYARSFFDTDEDPQEAFYAHRPRWKTTAGTQVFFSEGLAAGTGDPEKGLGYLLDGMDGLDFFNRAQYVECKLLLANYLLSSQGDRMAMAHSVEGRYPFLDHRVVEFAGSVPAPMKMKVLNEKYLLKRAMRDILPERIAARKKQPYMAPDILSFFGENEPEYLSYYLSEELLREAGLFKPQAVARLMDKCRKKSRQGFKENMAFVGMLSCQILYEKMIKNFQVSVPDRLEQVKVVSGH